MYGGVCNQGGNYAALIAVCGDAITVYRMVFPMMEYS